MRAILLASALLTAAHPLAAEDWPQFRGPSGQGVSAEIGLPLEWSESRNVHWKTAVPGIGWSSPVVAGDRVWVTTAVVDRNATSLRALAFDRAKLKHFFDNEEQVAGLIYQLLGRELAGKIKVSNRLLSAGNA